MPSSSPSTARALDKFYTCPDTASACLDRLQAWLSDLDLPSPDLWLEPSAGSGAFLDRLPEPRLGLDLAPEAAGIVRQDFLAWTPDPRLQRIFTIGNPPFGKNARLAVAFFNHAAAFSEIIAFIVPRSFEKASIKRRLDLFFHLADQLALPPAPFLFEGRSYAVPSVFQVWQRRSVLRRVSAPRRTHPDFEFVSREEGDFAFQRVGVRAGTVKPDFSHVAASSHFFLRSQGLPAARLIDRLRAIDFNEVKQRTAGNPSISKSELINLYVARHGPDESRRSSL